VRSSSSGTLRPWPETDVFETVYAETAEAVDDLYVKNSAV
jgi:hypothetical protein